MNEVLKALSPYKKQIDLERVEKTLIPRHQDLLHRRYDLFRNACESTQGIRATHVSFDTKTVEIGRKEELNLAQQEAISKALQTFIPWKKGPFSVFGTEIDAEWRSDLKWDRLKPFIPSLENRIVADIGCHNGYYMFRMLEQNPWMVLGFEPYGKLYYTFKMLNSFLPPNPLQFSLLGVEHMGFFKELFDVVFCLGILYHHSDPVKILKKINRSMRPEGTLVIDCQGIPGEDEICLFPQARYAHSRGLWFLPTESCLKNWLIRSQFDEIHCFYRSPLTSEEQRSTSWAPIKSLSDFLDPQNPHKTIEGYPAPYRFYMVATKKA